MGKFTQTEEHEPSDFETLYFSPSWLPDGVFLQNLIFGSTEKNILSMVMTKYDNKNPMAFCQMWFTREEVDLMIERLNEMKTRWDAEGWKNFEDTI
jgi:hypothetical protein